MRKGGMLYFSQKSLHIAVPLLAPWCMYEAHLLGFSSRLGFLYFPFNSGAFSPHHSPPFSMGDRVHHVALAGLVLAM